MLGIEEAYLPHSPFMGVPVFMAICAARKAPVVKGDQVVVGDLCKVTFSIDHR